LLSYFDLCRTLGKEITPPGGVDIFLGFIYSHFVEDSFSNFRYLDIASNTGIVSRELAKFGVHKQIECIDTSKSIVDWGNKLSADEGLVDIDFKCIDAYELPYISNHFDVINMGVSLGYFLNERNIAIENANRVLKPSGTLFVNNLYYKLKPPTSLLNSVQEILGTNISYPETMDYEFHQSYLTDMFELKAEVRFSYEGRHTKADYYENIKSHCLSNNPDMLNLNLEEQEELYWEYARQREILNENDLYCGSTLQAWIVK
jgi:ubiquinone/menaquinone biosynthesis C-methylase UbiE